MAKKAQDTAKSTKTDLRVKRKRKNTAIENRRVAEILDELSNFNLEKIQETAKAPVKPNMRVSKKEPKVLDKIEGFDEIDFLPSETSDVKSVELDVTEPVEEVTEEEIEQVKNDEVVENVEETETVENAEEVDSSNEDVELADDPKNESYPPVKNKRTIRCPKVNSEPKKEIKNNSLPIARHGIIKGAQQSTGQIIIKPKRTIHLGLKKHDEIKRARVVDVSINQNSPFFYEPSVFEKFNIRICDIDQIDDEGNNAPVEAETNEQVEDINEVVDEVLEEVANEPVQESQESENVIDDQILDEVITSDEFMKDFEEDDFKELFGESLAIDPIEKQDDKDDKDDEDEVEDDTPLDIEPDDDVLTSQISGENIDLVEDTQEDIEDDGEEDDIEFDSLEEEPLKEAADSNEKISSFASKIEIPRIFKKFTFDDAAISAGEMNYDDTDNMIINTVNQANDIVTPDTISASNTTNTDDISNMVVNAEPVATVAEPVVEDITMTDAVEPGEVNIPTNIITPNTSDEPSFDEDDIDIDELIKNNENKTKRRKLNKRDQIIEDELEPIFPSDNNDDDEVDEETNSFDIERYFGIVDDSTEKAVEEVPALDQEETAPEEPEEINEEAENTESTQEVSEEDEEILDNLDDFDIEDFEESLLDSNPIEEATSDEDTPIEDTSSEETPDEESPIEENQVEEQVEELLPDDIDIDDISLEDLELSENDLEGSLLDEHIDAENQEENSESDNADDEENIQGLLSKALLDDDSALNDDLKEELLSEVLSFESNSSPDEPSEETKEIYTELENSVDKSVDQDEVIYKDPTSDFVKIIDSLTKTITELENTSEIQAQPESDESGKSINILINKDDVFSISILNESYEIVADFDGISVLSENIHISTPKNNFFVYVGDKYIEIHKQVDHFALTTNFEDIEFANAINNVAFTKKDNKIELNIRDAFKVSSINNKVELSMLNKAIANITKNTDSSLPDERDNSSVCDNNTLLISEETQKVYLPYTIEEVMRKLNNSNEYQTIEEVVENEYTLPLSMFKNPIVSRFKEAYMFMRVKEKSSVYAALDLAVELMFNSNLNPAIIRACKDLKELNIYLDCLYENEVDKFDCFKIVYKVLPKA